MSLVIGANIVLQEQLRVRGLTIFVDGLWITEQGSNVLGKTFTTFSSSVVRCRRLPRPGEKSPNKASRTIDVPRPMFCVICIANYEKRLDTIEKTNGHKPSEETYRMKISIRGRQTTSL